MEWFLLYMVLSAISLQGFVLFMSGENFYGDALELRKEMANDSNETIGTIGWLSIVVGFTIVLPITMYMLLSMED